MRFGPWSRNLAARALAICLGAALVTSLVMILHVPVAYGLLQEPESRLCDQFFVWRSALKDILHWRGICPDDLVLITVDDESARRIGAYPPWPRQLYAALSSALSQAGADVIAFDMIFDGPSPLIKTAAFPVTSRLKNYLCRHLDPRWHPDAEADDQSLIDEFKTAKQVVLATNVELNVSLANGKSQVLFHAPYQPFISALGGDASCLGNVVVEPDADGIVRRGSLVSSSFPHIGSFYSSFALRVAEKKLQAVAIEDAEKVYLRDRTLPRSFNINYVGPPGTFQVISFWKALEWKKHFATSSGLLPDTGSEAKTLNPFQHKIVLIGYGDLLPDDAAVRSRLSNSSMPYNSFLTPVGSFSRPMSGLELQANLVMNILSGRLLHAPSNWEYVLTLLFVAILFARLFSALQGQPRTMLAAVFGFAVLWIVCCFLSFVYMECLLPCAVPLLGVVFPSALIVFADQNLLILRERRRHTSLFRQLAPKKMAAEIDRQQLSVLGLSGKEAVVTTLVCELAEFPSTVEGQSPERVVELFNECLNVMTMCVYEHEGIVDRYLSYGVLALWGAPLAVSETEQARLAAECALDIQRRVSELRLKWAESELLKDGFALDTLCGINTGKAVCGRIGAQGNFAYGAIGSAVDLSLSLKSANQTYGTTCLIGESTFKLISDRFETRELARCTPDGTGEKKSLYQLFCPRGELPGAMEESVSFYQQGLSAMSEGNLAEAERLFVTALRMAPDDEPSALMLSNCRQLMTESPAVEDRAKTASVSEQSI